MYVCICTHVCVYLCVYMYMYIQTCIYSIAECKYTCAFDFNILPSMLLIFKKYSMIYSIRHFFLGDGVVISEYRYCL